MSEGSEWDHNTPWEIAPDGVCPDLLGVAADVALILDEDGIVQTHADQDEPTLGYPPGHLRGESLASLYAHDARPSPLFDAGSVEGLERVILDEGSRATVPLEAADGSVVALSLRQVSDSGVTVCFGEDVTKRVDRVREHRADDRLFDSLGDPVYVLDSQDRFEQVNDALVEYTGYDRTELLGRTITELLPGTAYKRATAELLEQGDVPETAGTFETTFVTKEGTQILTEANVTVRTDQQGRYAGSVGVLRDIRERKHREQNLDLLKQVLTRVFRHDVRNELEVAQGHVELLQEHIDGGPQEHIDEVLETIARLLAHSEKARQIERVIEADERTELDIADRARSVVETARQEYPSATIDADLPAEALVEAHPAVGNAIRELVENAVEHAPDDESAHVTIWVDQRDGRKTLFVEDESGGLADNEVDVLEQGDEDDLKHSSGVGLWLIRWLVEYSRAEMIIHRTDAGSVMGIRFGLRATGNGSPETGTESLLASAPRHVREASPRRFRGSTVIGRTDRVDQLEGVYESIESTGGHAVLVTGEAGIGKTTLVEQFRDRITAQDSEVLVAAGFCDSDAQPSYHAFRQVMEDVPSDRDISEILADAASLSADDPDELERRKRSLFGDIADELRAVATDQPVVLVVEDMHWADSGTIDLFEYLVEEVGQWSHPVLFLGTYRTSDVDQAHPVLEIAAETADTGRGTVIELTPLDADEVRSLVSHMFGVEELPASFVEEINRQTGGTPLFVSELVQHLVETLGPVQASTDLPDSLDTVDLPATVESAITERLNTLPDDVRPVLQLGAVVGREFSFDLLREATDRPIDELFEAINTLVGHQVWRRSADRIEFVHGVVREQALQAIPEQRRETLHRNVATALETVHPDAFDEYAARIAHQYEQAGLSQAAFEYYQRAGEYAATRYANQEAIDHYQRAMALATDHEAGEPIEVAVVAAALGDLFKLRGVSDSAREYYQQSLAVARDCESEEHETVALLNLGKLAESQSKFDRAQERYEQCLEIARVRGDREHETKALINLGVIAEWRSELDRAERLHEESLEIAREQGDRHSEARCLVSLGNVALRYSEYDRAQEYYETGLSVVREVGDREIEATALNNLGLIARERSEYDRERDFLEQSLEVSREIGDREGEARALVNLGTNYKNRGKYHRAQEYQKESLAIFEDLGHRQSIANCRGNLAILFERRGEYDRAREYYEQSLDIFKEVGDSSGEATCFEELGNLVKKQGAYEQAREYCEQSLETRREIGSRQGEAESLALLGQISRLQGEFERAQRHQTDALELAREIGATEQEITALRELGAVARQRGDDEQAAEYLADARNACAGNKEFHNEAAVQLEQARLALDRDDVETARECAEQARRCFAELGARHERAAAVLAEGRIAAMDGSPEAACQHWQEAVETFRDVGAPQDTLAALRRLFETRRQQGNGTLATEYREQAQEVFETAPGPVQAEHEDWLGTE